MPPAAGRSSATRRGTLGKSRLLLVLAVIIVLVGAFFVFDLGQYFSLAYVKSQQAAIDGY